MLTYVGWRVVCDTCGVTVEIGGVEIHLGP